MEILAANQIAWLFVSHSAVRREGVVQGIERVLHASEFERERERKKGWQRVRESGCDTVRRKRRVKVARGRHGRARHCLVSRENREGARGSGCRRVTG